MRHGMTKSLTAIATAVAVLLRIALSGVFGASFLLAPKQPKETDIVHDLNPVRGTEDDNRFLVEVIVGRAQNVYLACDSSFNDWLVLRVVDNGPQRFR
jgi:hypothetical protein